MKNSNTAERLIYYRIAKALKDSEAYARQVTKSTTHISRNRKTVVRMQSKYNRLSVRRNGNVHISLFPRLRPYSCASNLPRINIK